ncbi:2393_t:CDS:1, partial [Paraglomus occultum]
EFVDKNENGNPKQFRTCNNCRNQRNRPSTSNNARDNEECLETIEIEALCQSLRELLNNCDLENRNLLATQLHYALDVSNFDDSAKKIANEIVGLIEDIGEYNWV